jgi:hypothetical protein
VASWRAVRVWSRERTIPSRGGADSGANPPLRVQAAQNGNDPRGCGGRFVSFREEPDAYLVSGAAGAFFIAAFFAAAFFTIAR